MNPYIKHTPCPDRDYGMYEQLGMAVRCMLYNKNYSTYPVSCLQQWTEFAIQHGQIYFVYSNNGLPLAYMTWATLAADTQARLVSDPAFNLHPSEWNEKGDIWILDFCCKPGYGALAAREILAAAPWGAGPAHWLSRKKRTFTSRTAQYSQGGSHVDAQTD
ncbi:toxin-activating lysine-acyltransferase [Pseudomonas sp. NPDC089734]|uniref:toxin-activating lysine-acyltransferase n=1 Tax=Pseudomonas sp. NPDC089734 TaxID=3364469 RepID=UPI0038011E81